MLSHPPYPLGHYLTRLRYYYLPLAIERKEFWEEYYQRVDRYSRKYVEDQIFFANQNIKKIHAVLNHLSAA